MNVLKKLQSARNELQALNLKKSGKNDFSKYSYYELADFLPSINKINERLGITAALSLSPEACLTIFNSDDPSDCIQFTSRVGTSSLKGAHDIQNLGSEHTYMRRYMYMLAYEIVEHDAVDASNGKPDVDEKSEKMYIEAIEATVTNDCLLNSYNTINEGFKMSKALNNALSSRKIQINKKEK